MLLSIPMAFAAGIAAFFSPCVLPLIPVWLAFLGGNKADSKLTLAGNLLFFVAGFALIFTALGATATALGQLLFRYQTILIRIAGGILVVFGLQMLGVFQLYFLQRKLGFSYSPKQTPMGYFLLGIVLALGWTPCVGMMLASILMLAGSLKTVYQGMLLLLVFSLGFALPFTLTGLIVGPNVFSKLSRRASRFIQQGAGLVLVFMGLLLIFNKWIWFQSLFI